MLPEIEVRETASADELLVNPETGLPDFKYTSSVVNAVSEGLDNALSGGTSTHAPAESPVMDTLQGLAHGAGKAAFELIAPVGDFLQVGNELGRSWITGEAPREINFISGIGQMAAQGATTADIINGGFVSLLTTPDRIGDAYERGDYRSMGEEFGALGLNAALAGAGLRGSMPNVKVGAQLAVEDFAASSVGKRLGVAIEGYQYQTGALSYASEPGLNVPSSWQTGVNNGVTAESGALQRIAANNQAGSPWADLRSAYQQAKGQVDFSHIEADVNLFANGGYSAKGGHFSASPLVDIIPGTESVGGNGSMWAQISLKGADGKWYLKTNNNGFSSLTPSDWSLAQAKGEMSQAFLGRSQLPNGNWMGNSSGVDFRFYPPTKNVLLWRGFPEYTP